MQPTREKILKAAEAVFLEKGFSAASVREITQRADVNVASINYHFGSKEALISALFKDYTQKLNKMRIHQLESLEVTGSPKQRMEAVVRIMVIPVLETVFNNKHGARGILFLYGRALAEGDEFRKRVDAEVFGDVFEALSNAFRRVVGVESNKRIHLMCHLLISTALGTLLHTPRVSSFTPDALQEKDMSKITEDLIRFICGGLHEVLEQA